MKDASVVEVFQPRYDLPEIIANFWVRQCVPCLPNVSEGLQRQGMMSLPSIPNTVPECQRFQNVQKSTTEPRTSPFYCRALRKYRCCPGPRNDGRTSLRACERGFCGARFHSLSVGRKINAIVNNHNSSGVMDLLLWRRGREGGREDVKTMICDIQLVRCTLSLWWGLDTLLCGITFTAYILLLARSVIS